MLACLARRYGLPALVALAQSGDPECRYAAALCLRKLTPNEAAHLSLVESGALPALMQLVRPKHRKPTVSPWAASASAAAVSKARGLGSSSGALALAGADAGSPDNTQMLLAGSLNNESDEEEGEENDEEVVLDAKTSLVVRTHALASLRDLSDNPDVQKAFVEEVRVPTAFFADPRAPSLQAAARAFPQDATTAHPSSQKPNTKFCTRARLW